MSADNARFPTYKTRVNGDREIDNLEEVACTETKSRTSSLESFIRFQYYLCFVPYRPIITQDGLVSFDRFILQQVSNS